MRLPILLLALSTLTAGAQPWFKRIDTVVVNDGTQDLKNAWAGGLNFTQLSEIDLDYDGTQDLLIFDRSGDRLMPFLNGGTSNTVDYTFDAQFRNNFPSIQYWILLRDYNCDGEKDIFTYSDITNGVKVYRNSGNVSSGLDFTLENSLVHYKDSKGDSYPIYISAADIPVINDIDNDGDLDILTFNLEGTMVNYFQNQSMELYSHCDSLSFELTDGCWGNFEEDFSSFNVTLGISCKGTSINRSLENKHAGSCGVCLDMDDDGDMEMLLGDISNENMILLTNGGDSLAANITSADTSFPSNDLAVQLPLFPCPYYVDFDNDGKKDLVISPNAENVSENYQGHLYYKNTGTESNPQFTFLQNDFLQGEMIDVGEGAYPVFFDYNKDGLVDLLIGNYGYHPGGAGFYKGQVANFRNVGTLTNPKFQLESTDFQSLSSLNLQNLVPTFGDVDGDFDDDMIIGDHEGKLHYFENSAGSGFPVTLTLKEANMKDSAGNTIDIGNVAAPQLVDVDGDGLVDLLIGERKGTINYYRNTGAGKFVETSTKLGNVNVAEDSFLSGHSFPFLFKDQGKTKLLVGAERGSLFLYENIDNNLSGDFTQVTTEHEWINEGLRASVHGADINNDGYLDIVVGNYAGGVSLFMGQANSIGLEEHFSNTLEARVYPNPAKDFLSIELKEKGNTKIEILNVVGQILQQVRSNNQITNVDCTALAEGIYFIRITDEDSLQSAVKRVLITH